MIEKQRDIFKICSSGSGLPLAYFTIHPDEKKGSLFLNLHKRLKLTKKRIKRDNIFALTFIVLDPDPHRDSRIRVPAMDPDFSISIDFLKRRNALLSNPILKIRNRHNNYPVKLTTGTLKTCTNSLTILCRPCTPTSHKTSVCAVFYFSCLITGVFFS